MKDLNVNPKMKTVEEKGTGVHSQHFGGRKDMLKFRDGGLRHVISGSIIHMDLHKPNNKLVSA